MFGERSCSRYTARVVHFLVNFNQSFGQFGEHDQWRNVKCYSLKISIQNLIFYLKVSFSAKKTQQQGLSELSVTTEVKAKVSIEQNCGEVQLIEEFAKFMHNFYNF